MARVKRDSRLEDRTNRAKLPVRHEPYWLVLEPGKALGYRKGVKSGVWMARVWDPTVNPPRRKSVLGAADDHADPNGIDIFSFKEAQDKAREWFTGESERETGETRQKGPYTVRDAWLAYEKDAVRRGMKGLDRTQCAAELHILPALGHIEVAKLRQKKIEDWHENLSKSAARVRTKADAKEPATRPAPKTADEKRARKDTANRVLTILKALLNFAKRKRKTTATGDAWREAEPFRETTATRVRFLSPEEAQRLVNVCQPDFQLLVKAAMFTGARYGELTRLRARDFNAKGGQGRGTVSIEESKSGKPRHVVLTAEGLGFFQEVTAGLKGNSLIFTREAFPDMRRVEPETGKPVPKVQREWRKADQQHPLKEACKAAGIGGFTFHELRHTYASGLVNAGVPLAYVAAQLGHSDTRMTEKHYGHLAPSALADAIGTLAPTLGIHQASGLKTLRIKQA